ncbi:MAG TPA: GntR family transcriptional regulator [Deltaproteobacteria bacterium]|nr:GntR family transcriptional regulator [Deltaproteobacteria bacterium]
MEKVKLLDFPVSKPQTLRERIVDFVKDAVVSGRLKPGDRVPEAELAETFGISRTPIREAFRQLESEGFLTVTPRKGAVITSITDRDVREFYAIKSILEGYAARVACERLTERDIRRLASLNVQMGRCADRDDVKGFFRLDNLFHEIFLRACGNEKLLTLLGQLVQQFERLRIASLSVRGRMHTSVRQHGEIIDAFRSRDADLVERLVRANAEMGGEILVQEILREQEDANG